MTRTVVYMFLLCWVIFQNSCKTQHHSYEEVINLYASKYLEENGYIFNKSIETLKPFKEAIGMPLTLKKIKEATDPVGDISLDSFITSDMLEDWNGQINSYEQISWNKKSFSNLPFIDENEIPDFFYQGGIPSSDEKVITIHFLSTPFISNNVALLFFSQRTSPLNGSSGYRIFVKKNDQWKLIAVNNILWTS